MSKKSTNPTEAAAAHLDTLQARRDELAAALPTHRADLEAAQGDLIDGKPGAEQAVTDAQARLSGAEGTLRLLDERLDAARQELDRLQHADAAEAIKAEMTAAANAAAEHVAADAAAHARLREAFETEAAEIAARRLAWREATRTFDRLARSIEAHGVTQARVRESLREQGVDLADVTLERLPNPDLGEYAPAIAPAIQTALSLMQRAERKEAHREEQAQAQAAPQAAAA